MVGQMQRKEVDICIGGLTIMEVRSKAVDLSTGIISDQCKIFVHSGSLDFNYYEMYFIFNNSTWQCILWAVLVTAAVLFIFFHSEKQPRYYQLYMLIYYEYTSIMTVSCSHSRFGFLTNLANALALPMRAIIIKGHTRMPIYLGGKIIAITILLFGTMIFSLYRGGLLSKLAVKTSKYPINAMEDILDSPIMLGTLGSSSSLQEYFEHAKPGSLQHNLWENEVKDNLMDNPDKALERVATDDEFAYFTYEGSGKTSPLYPCQTTTIGPGYLKISEGFGFQKNRFCYPNTF